MNLRLPKFSGFSRPRGLQARAVIFTSALMALTAAVSAAILIFGAQTEGERQQISIAHDLTQYLATKAGDVMAAADPREEPFQELLSEPQTSEHGDLPDDGPLPQIKPRAAAIPAPEAPIATEAPEKPKWAKSSAERCRIAPRFAS